jgi:hypothetical protein
MANPHSRGRQRDKLFRDALRMEIAAAGEDRKALRKVAKALMHKAEAGDVQAIRELADRLDGKVPQAVVGDDEHPSVTGYKEFLSWMQLLGTPMPPGHNSSASIDGANGSAKLSPTDAPEKPSPA